MIRPLLSLQKKAIRRRDKISALVAEKGYDPSFGARPVKRAVQTWVENPLSKQLLEGNFTEGTTIKVTASGGELSFS